MPQELLWLLLVVAAACVWILAHRIQRPGKSLPHKQIPVDYYKGINYFLNEQPDKAIDVFIRMLELDSETVEPHLALGNLFRRRGEVDRAIRIHQNLIARPSLSKQQRDQALLELGHDYLQAGLLDRAESLLVELTEHDGHNVAALRLLKEIYEQEKEWSNAISVTRNIDAITGERHRNIIAQYYCELAVQTIQSGEHVQARKIITKALAINPACVRAHITQGELERSCGNLKGAIKAYKRSIQQSADSLNEIITPLMECYAALGKESEMLGYLHKIIPEQALINPVRPYIELFSRQQGTRPAAQYLVNYLQRHPSVQGLACLLEMMDEDNDSLISENNKAVRTVLDKLADKIPLYVCKNCGFTGNTMHWQCPGCRQWETLAPNSNHYGRANVFTISQEKQPQ